MPVLFSTIERLLKKSLTWSVLALSWSVLALTWSVLALTCSHLVSPGRVFLSTWWIPVVRSSLLAVPFIRITLVSSLAMRYVQPLVANCVCFWGLVRSLQADKCLLLSEAAAPQKQRGCGANSRIQRSRGASAPRLQVPPLTPSDPEKRNDTTENSKTISTCRLERRHRDAEILLATASDITRGQKHTLRAT